LRAQRKITLWIGVGGIVTLLFAVLLMWLVVYQEDLMSAPVPVDENAPPTREQILPDTPKENKDAQPEKPEKPPPLNQ